MFNVGDIVKHTLADTKMVVIEVNKRPTVNDAGQFPIIGYVCRWHGKRIDTGEEVFLKDTFLESELVKA